MNATTRAAGWVAALLLASLTAAPLAAAPKDPAKSGAKPAKPAPRAAPPASKTKPGPATPQRQQSLQREQRELQAELAKLKRQLAATEASRSATSDALAASERAISQTNRRLRELAAARARIESQVAVLAQRERNVLARQGDEQRRLDEWLRLQHAVDEDQPLQRLLLGGDANQRARDSTYLAYLSRDADAALALLQQRRIELASLKDETAQKSVELSKIAADEVASRAQLEREQAQRKRALDQLGQQIAGQRQSIARLEQDDKRLAALLDRISNVLAEQQRREAQRARQPSGPQAPDKTTGSAGGTAKAPPRPGSSGSIAGFSPPTDGKFAQNKGKLVLPVAGTVTARFGSTRQGEGGSGPSWKGVFIRAPAGADVRAVGDGQVVFADWLRGFGNLLVIDHGDGFLSVYGNNEAVLRNVGDRVAVGEVISSVGNTGGNETPGLYFELRFQGRPFDPLTWVAAR